MRDLKMLDQIAAVGNAGPKLQEQKFETGLTFLEHVVRV